jgi:hypothetical protein
LLYVCDVPHVDGSHWHVHLHTCRRGFDWGGARLAR